MLSDAHFDFSSQPTSPVGSVASRGDDLVGGEGDVGELYLNRGEWKFRAIGQGYASGLAGIARDSGVDIG